MNTTFGEHLKQFALAVDTVDKDSFHDAKDLVLDYFRRTLNIEITRLMVEAKVAEMDGLITYNLVSKAVYSVRPVRDHKGEFTSHTAYAYGTNKSLWIVSGDKNEKRLEHCESWVDLWSNSKDLPAYKVPSGESLKESARTSIIIPVLTDSRVFGVFNFETTEYLDITASAKKELTLVVDALVLLYQTYLKYERKLEDTRTAFNKLNDLLQHPLPKLTKPNIFLASSHRAASDAVKQTFKEEEFANKFQVVYWKEMHAPGNINTQLLEVLGTCRYGVCYFSERLGSKGNRFRDNPNVLFEAGMLHGRSDQGAQSPASWIPIREASSKTPFDFASERTIIVPRSKDGILDEAQFKDILRKRIRVLVGEEEHKEEDSAPIHIRPIKSTRGNSSGAAFIKQGDPRTAVTRTDCN